MANSKQRRERKRLLNAKKQLAVTISSQTQKPQTATSSFFKKLFGIVLSVGTLLSFLFLIPHLVIQEDFKLDETNPYSSSFYVENEGLLPATSISAICTIDTNISNGKGWDITINHGGGYDAVIDPGLHLHYRQRTTLPCNFSGISFRNPMQYKQGSKSKVEVSYHLFGLPISRHQTFDFTLAQGKNGQYHWLYR
jgi:hypothetical protein